MTIKKPPKIKTERLLLQPFLEESRASAIKLFTDKKVCETYMFPEFQGEEASLFFTRFKAASENPERFIYAAYFEKIFIGFINYVSIEGKTIELGYVIAPAYQKKGFATEMLQVAVAELFAEGYEVIRCGFFEGNIASQRVMEKAGFLKTEKQEEIIYRKLKHKCFYMEIKKS